MRVRDKRGQSLCNTVITITNHVIRDCLFGSKLPFDQISLSPFIYHTMALLKHTILTVQQYTYSEYVGVGDPLAILNPVLAPGDIYIDLADPHRILYWTGQIWNQWTSMGACMDHLNPTLTPTRILLPTSKQFSWVPSSGRIGYQDIVARRLGPREDCAKTHVTIFAKTNSLTIDSPQIPIPLFPTDSNVTPGVAGPSNKRKTSDGAHDRRVAMRLKDPEGSSGKEGK
jgi:hypothetical protein